ncbi:MAG: AraC family transcriptional regulator [Clostridiales bacterium]|nr:AraC family transcriptional regulator [Clostridiales bacterium]
MARKPVQTQSEKYFPRPGVHYEPSSTVDYSLLNLLKNCSITMNCNEMQVQIYEFAYHENKNMEFLHSSEFYKLYYVIDGEMVLLIDGEEVSLSAGDICMINRHVSHASAYQPGLEQKYIQIVFDLSPCSYKGFHDINPVEHYEVDAIMESVAIQKYWVRTDKNNFISSLNIICDDLKKNHLDTFLRMRNMLYSLLITALQNNSRPLPAEMKEITFPKNKAVAIVEYIWDHYGENITLETAAQAMNISYRHINRVLKSYYGTTFSKILATHRLNVAKHYLAETDYSIERTAELVGLSYASSLQELLKKTDGITVSEYRRRHKQKKAVVCFQKECLEKSE